MLAQRHRSRSPISTRTTRHEVNEVFYGDGGHAFTESTSVSTYSRPAATDQPAAQSEESKKPEPKKVSYVVKFALRKIHILDVPAGLWEKARWRVGKLGQTVIGSCRVIPAS